MVDLVKIRKKAKKNAEAGEQEAASATASEREAASGEREKTTVIPSGSEGPGRAGGAQNEANAGGREAASGEQEQTAVIPSGSEGPGRAGGAQNEATAGGREAASSEREAATSVQRSTTSESKLDRFKEEAGKRREGFISSETVAATGELLELLTFLIAGEQYALDIEHIVEIVPPRDVTRVPNADDSIVGIISLRGTIVTIVDVRRRLRHGSSAADRPRGTAASEARVIVVQYGSETVGFEVDRVLRVVKVDRAAVESHPIVHSSEQSEAIRGVFRQANALTILLDFDKLLDARHGTHL
jgi:purine-binding chemotaxis protein CheW